MSTAARLLAPRPSSRPASLQVAVLQVPVLEGEALLLPLAPLLIVKVDVSALEVEETVQRTAVSVECPRQRTRGKTIAYSHFTIVLDVPERGKKVPRTSHI